MRLQELLEGYKVVGSGFSALEKLTDYSSGFKEVHVSSLSPALLLENGVKRFYALVLPRGAKYRTPEEIIKVNPEIKEYYIESVDNKTVKNLDVVIVTRHLPTANILLNLYPTSNPKPRYEEVTADMIRGKHVVGTLPPHLVVEAEAYTSVTIKDYDFWVDSELSGEELTNRLVIATNAITVKEIIDLSWYKDIYKVQNEFKLLVRENDNVVYHSSHKYLEDACQVGKQLGVETLITNEILVKAEVSWGRKHRQLVYDVDGLLRGSMDLSDGNGNDLSIGF